MNLIIYPLFMLCEVRGGGGGGGGECLNFKLLYYTHYSIDFTEKSLQEGRKLWKMKAKILNTAPPPLTLGMVLNDAHSMYYVVTACS